jgi:hypothetical protein
MDRRVACVVALLAVLSAVAPGVAAQSGTTYTMAAGEDLTATDGPTVELQSNITVATDYDWFPDRSTVALPNRGTVAATGAGGYVEVSDWDGTTTRVTDIDTNGTTITINPDSKTRISVGGSATSLNFTDYAVDDGETDFTYAGPNGTTTRVTVYGLPGSTPVAAYSAGMQLDSKRTDANGQVTFTLPNSEHSVQLRTIDPGRPRIENAEPQGDQSTAPTELQFTVADPEFSEGDRVNVTTSLDGTQINQTTVTSETRLTIPVTGLASGTHSWTVTATDQFNQTTTKTYSFGVPATLDIHNVSAPETLVTQPVEVRVYRLNNETILTRTVADGTLNMSGLPAGETLIFEFTNASNYTDRTMLITRLSEEEDAYLLPNSTERVVVRFVLDDQTGQYDESQSQLLVKAPITVNNTTQYRTVIGERFGAAGVTQPLRVGERYRLVIRNQEGDIYVPGNYRTDIAETVTLVVRAQGSTNRDPGSPYAWEARQVNVDDAPDSVVYEYSDPQNETRNLDLTISRRNNETTVAEYYFAGPVGNVTIAQPVNESYEDGGYIVAWEAERADGDIGARKIVGTGTIILPGLALFWRQAFAAGIILLTGGAFSQANAGAGAVIIGILGGIFWFIGWLTGAAAGAVVLVLAIAAVWKLRSGGVF